jgi:hypothetical protein
MKPREALKRDGTEVVKSGGERAPRIATRGDRRGRIRRASPDSHYIADPPDTDQ